MKMKQMLKPKAVPTIFPMALPNCSPPSAKRRGTVLENSEASLVIIVLLIKSLSTCKCFNVEV